MKRKITKILINAAAICLLASLSVMSFSATTYFYSNGFEFYKEDGALVISDYTDSTESLVIPNELIDIKVSAVGPSAFKGREDIKALTLSDSLEYISAFSFADCTSLAEVNNITPGLKNIYLGAFQNTALEEIDLSKAALTQVSDQIFYNCKALKKAVLPESAIKIGDNTFRSCPSLSYVYIPASVNEIGDNVFRDSPNIVIYGSKNSYAEKYAAENGIPFTECKEMGDVDLSGKMDIRDATVIQKYIANLTDLNEYQLTLADVNGDGKVNILDATRIQLIIANLEK